ARCQTGRAVVVRRHDGAGRHHTAAGDPLGGEAPPRRNDSAHRVAHGIEGSARVEQGAQHHVAADAIGAVEVGDGHRDDIRRAARAMRKAAIAAPKPLSMLTTVRPAAHEASIPSSAAMPSKAAPYPVLVGTATTGTCTRPPTTEGRAP